MLNCESWVSFTLKEEVSEYLKDEIANVKDVLAREHAGYDGGLLGQKLTAIGKGIEKLGGSTTPTTPPWLDTLHRKDDLFTEINEMAEVLPDAAIYKRKAKDAFDEQKSLSNELLDYDSPQLQTTDNLSKVGKLHEEAIVLRLNLYGEVLARKDTLEKESAITRVSVYSLFLFGWTLGLALSLVGEAPKAE